VPTATAGEKLNTATDGSSSHAPVSTVVAAKSPVAELAVAAAAAAATVTTSAAPVAASPAAVDVKTPAVAASDSSAQVGGVAAATTSATAGPTVTARAVPSTSELPASTSSATADVAAAAAAAAALAAAAVAVVPAARRRAAAHALLDELLPSFEQLACGCIDIEEHFPGAVSDSDEVLLLETANEQLLGAVMNDDVDAAAEALDCGADVDTTDADGK
jgi:trimeric autotransporter adhesin